MDAKSLTLLLAGLLAGTWSTTLAAVLCKTRSESVKVRDTCKPREVQLDPIALGLQGPTGPTGPAGPAPADESVRVYNSSATSIPNETGGGFVNRCVNEIRRQASG